MCVPKAARSSWLCNNEVYKITENIQVLAEFRTRDSNASSFEKWDPYCIVSVTFPLG